MAAISVRQLDDDVVDRLKQRASSNNRSLKGEIRHILECAASDHMAAKRIAFLEASDRLREKTRATSKLRPKRWSARIETAVIVADSNALRRRCEHSGQATGRRA